MILSETDSNAAHRGIMEKFFAMQERVEVKARTLLLRERLPTRCLS